MMAKRLVCGLALGLMATCFAAPLSAQERAFGPPRVAAVEGDREAAPLGDRDLLNLQAFTRAYLLARWFHPSDAAVSTDWDALAINSIPAVLAADSPQALAGTFEGIFGPIIEGFEVSAVALPVAASSPTAETLWQWEHKGFDGAMRTGFSKKRIEVPAAEAPAPIEEVTDAGVHFRIPLTVPIRTLTTPPASISTAFLSKPADWTPAGFDRTTRLAATLIAWSVLDQFSPYWDVVDADWDAQLVRSLQEAATAEDDRAFEAVLWRLIHALRDGHGTVLYSRKHWAQPPVLLDVVEGKIAVAWAAPATGIAAGSVVESIDGDEVETRVAETMQSRSSGSEHFRRWVAMADVLRGPEGSTVELATMSPGGSQTVTKLERVRGADLPFSAPSGLEPIAEVEPGLLYIDLTRADQETLTSAADRLAQAKGLVFDVRGRPAARPFYLPYLTDKTARSAQFLMPTFVRPDQVDATFEDFGWGFEAEQPRFTDNVAWLSNAAAVSFPESILGTVKNSGLGTIVGQASAGANGNISAFDLPGGYRVIFTGLKVVNRDGGTHHNIGVLPDVAVEPTLAGLREGRDEVLEKALEIVRQGMDDS